MWYAGFRVVNVVKLQMRVGSAQQQQAITSIICPGYDSCSGEFHFHAVRRLLAMLSEVLACKSTMSAVALSEGTQRKSDGTVPLVRHDASWESVFAQLRSVPEEMMGTTTSSGLRKAWETSVFFFRTSIPPVASISFQMRGALLKRLVLQRRVAPLWNSER